MKTFIFLSIIVITLFSYILFYDSYKREINKDPSYSLSLEEIESDQKRDIANEVEEYTHLLKDEPKEIPQEQVFDTIKNIIAKASKRSYTDHITLNTRVDSLLYTQEAKEEFKMGISTAFNISYDEVEKEFLKNRLVWDWVNKFKE